MDDPLNRLREILEADPDPNGYTLLALDTLEGVEEAPNWPEIDSRRVDMLGWKPGDEWKTG